MGLLDFGDQQKTLAETNMNEQSSRSHTIFKVEIQRTQFGGQDKGYNQKSYNSHLTLVDLAGSESIQKAKTKDERLKEGKNINTSLLALSKVITLLSRSNQHKKNDYVNFRDSKLTRILQSALTGNSQTAIVLTASQTKANLQETMNTINFGKSASKVKINVKQNKEILFVPVCENTLLGYRQRIVLLEQLLNKNEKALEDLRQKEKQWEKSLRDQRNQIQGFEEIKDLVDDLNQVLEGKNKSISELKLENKELLQEIDKLKEQMVIL